MPNYTKIIQNLLNEIDPNKTYVLVCHPDRKELIRQAILDNDCSWKFEVQCFMAQNLRYDKDTIFILENYKPVTFIFD